MSMKKPPPKLPRPDPAMLLRGGIAAVLFTALGLFVYSKAKKQMILYV